MITRGWSALIVAVALLHAGAYIAHQRHDWPNELVFSDRGEFEQLGKNLLAYGRYTRYPEASPPIAESERTPGYPLMLAAVYAVFGPSRMAAALVQAGLFALMCLLVVRIGAMLWSRSVGLVSGLAVALYPPFPYWAALTLTETLATALATTAVFFLLRGLRSRATVDFVVTGLALGYLTLTRPAWALLAPMLTVALVVVARRRPGLTVAGRQLAFTVGAAMLVVAPWLGFVYAHFHVVSLNPIGLWKAAYWGYWHGVYPGRVGVALSAVAESDLQGEALEARLREIGPDVDRMRTFVAEHRHIGALWRGKTDVHEMTKAKLQVETAARGFIVAHLRQGDLWGHVWRRLGYGTFTLWAADIPIRYTLINATPVIVIRLIEAAQVLLLTLAAAGVVVLWRRDAVLATVALVPLLYTELIHLPIHSDIRFSLPVKPLVLVLAVVAVARLAWAPAPVGAGDGRVMAQRVTG